MGIQLFSKTRLGKHFSEGSRQLWILVEARGWTQAALAADIRAHRPPRAGQQQTGNADQSKPRRVITSVVSRWLYGERAPDRTSAILLQELYGIDVTLWSKAPVEPFLPPAARDAAKVAA